MGSNFDPRVAGLVGKLDYLLLAQTGVAVSLTGTTSKTLLYSVDVPANLLGEHSSLEIRPYWSYPNSANNKVLDVEIGPNAGSVASVWTRTRTTTVGEGPHILIFNRGALNSQIMVHSSTGDAGTGFNAAYATYAIDFSVDNTIFVYGTLASGAETLKLETLRVAVHGPGRGSA